MAAKKDAVTNDYDDDLLVNIGGTISNLESSHDAGTYTFVPWEPFDYSNFVDPGYTSEGGTVVEDIRVFPRVPKERVM